MSRRTREQKSIRCEFGKKIKIKLMEKGMTQGQLAKEVGMHPQHLIDVIYGRRSGVSYREPIKKVLGL